VGDTVNLTPRSWQAPGDPVDPTRATKTDVINRAIQVYAYIEGIIQNNGAAPG